MDRVPAPSGSSKSKVEEDIPDLSKLSLKGSNENNNNYLTSQPPTVAVKPGVDSLKSDSESLIPNGYVHDYTHYQNRFASAEDKQKYMSKLNSQASNGAPETKALHIPELPDYLLRDECFFFSWLMELEGNYYLNFRKDTLQEIVTANEIEVVEQHGRDLSFVPLPLEQGNQKESDAYDLEKYRSIIHSQSFNFTIIKAFTHYAAENLDRFEEIVHVLDVFLAYCLENDIVLKDYLYAASHMINGLKVLSQLFGKRKPKIQQLSARNLDSSVNITNNSLAMGFVYFTKACFVSLLYSCRDPLALHIQYLLKVLFIYLFICCLALVND